MSASFGKGWLGEARLSCGSVYLLQHGGGYVLPATALETVSSRAHAWIDGKIKARASVQEGNPASYFFYNSQVPAAGVLLEFFRSGFGFGQQPAEGHGLGLIDARGFELI